MMAFTTIFAFKNEFLFTYLIISYLWTLICIMTPLITAITLNSVYSTVSTNHNIGTFRDSWSILVISSLIIRVSSNSSIMTTTTSNTILIKTGLGIAQNTIGCLHSCWKRICSQYHIFLDFTNLVTKTNLICV